MGPPSLQKDLYYDVENNQFVKSEPEIPVSDIPATQEEAITPIVEPGKQENIIEFLYDIFQKDETPRHENNETPLEPLQPLEP